MKSRCRARTTAPSVMPFGPNAVCCKSDTECRSRRAGRAPAISRRAVPPAPATRLYPHPRSGTSDVVQDQRPHEQVVVGVSRAPLRGSNSTKLTPAWGLVTGGAAQSRSGKGRDARPRAAAIGTSLQAIVARTEVEAIRVVWIDREALAEAASVLVAPHAEWHRGRHSRSCLGRPIAGWLPARSCTFQPRRKRPAHCGDREPRSPRRSSFPRPYRPAVQSSAADCGHNDKAPRCRYAGTQVPARRS